MYYDEVEPCINSVIASEHAMFTNWLLYAKCKGDWDKVADFEMFVY
jgi:hypothetical protein